MMADGEGKIDEVAFMELIAQSYAAFKGYMDRRNGKPPGEGFLVGVRNLEVTGRAYAGDRLLTSIRTVTAFGGFAVVEGSRHPRRRNPRVRDHQAVARRRDGR